MTSEPSIKYNLGRLRNEGVKISGSSGINVGQTEEAEDFYLYADAPHTQIFRPNRRGYNARANDLNLPILWLDF